MPGPYVLVGHSFGGLLAAMYAGTHPAEVAGLVRKIPAVPVCVLGATRLGDLPPSCGIQRTLGTVR